MHQVLEKKCSRCQEIKPHHEFGRDTRNKSGMRPYCRGCHNKSQRDCYEGKGRDVQTLSGIVADSATTERNLASVDAACHRWLLKNDAAYAKQASQPFVFGKGWK